ncbi:hypothetical protein K7432_009232 [Basidiobolus ranarum]|uniref:Uncharacterized protein n=1 Tax=Basidiobolus ranarum TaxID=34480 RepID=A0ABR2VXR8_9FUNG
MPEPQPAFQRLLWRHSEWESNDFDIKLSWNLLDTTIGSISGGYFRKFGYRGGSRERRVSCTFNLDSSVSLLTRAWATLEFDVLCILDGKCGSEICLNMLWKEQCRVNRKMFQKV